MKLASDATPMVIHSLETWNKPEELNSKFVDASTQTELKIDEHLTSLENEVIILSERVRELEKFQESLRTIFTEGQMRKITFPEKAIHWTWNDISPAIALHFAGSRAYRYLYNKGYPLPCESTIIKWLQKLRFDDGILKFSIGVMKGANNASEADRLCILSFEMKVDYVYEYDALSDTVWKPCNYVQLVMARGLKNSWKQPIFYSFDCKMSKQIIHNILVERDLGVSCDNHNLKKKNKKKKKKKMTVSKRGFIE